MRRHTKATTALGLLIALLAVVAAPASAAPPLVTEQLPVTVDHTSANLRAKVNPNGLPTTYHFEWGVGTSYSNRVPADHELFIGSETNPVTVSANLSGLSEGTTHFFRVVATNANGTTTGPDQRFETLNEMGLPGDRRYELVSPPDKGPAGEAGQAVGTRAQLPYQPSPDGEEIAYQIGYALPDSTDGGETVFRAERSPAGWLTAQVSPSLIGERSPSGTQETFNIASRELWLSRDLECGFTVSSLELTEDAAALPAIEAGQMNLYRRNPDASYDLVTNLVPTSFPVNGNPLDFYYIVGAAEDCSRIVFSAPYSYPGIPSTGLYKWEDGVLTGLGVIPGPSGDQVATVDAGASGTHSNWKAASEDARSVFFTATRATSPLPTEIGKKAVFLRRDGTQTIDVSRSKTGTANNDDARYQMATPDGAHVFFIGRYGLAANGTSTGPALCTDASGNTLGLGCDLYRYSVASETLTDVSVDTNPADAATGAGVAGVLAASDDGEYVYFAAKGQLIPGKGQTQAENVAVATRAYNVYLWHAGTVSYVATVRQSDATAGSAGGGAGLLASSSNIQIANMWSSQTTPSGEHLIFHSSFYTGAIEAYRYSADATTIVCVSCRRDGQPIVPYNQAARFPLEEINQNPALRAHRPVAISEDGSRIFFRKRDPLAPGALDPSEPGNNFAGDPNLYEWHDGQVSALVAGIDGLDYIYAPALAGASVDGSSVFFRTKQSLIPQDTDGRQDIYAARIGGGFEPAPPPPSPCDPLSEGGCQGGSAPTVAAPAAPGSATLQGPGNTAEQPKVKKKKKQARKRKKQQGKRKAKQRRGSKTRAAGRNGRAGR